VTSNWCVGIDGPVPLETFLEVNADILLMTSRGSLAEDLALIRKVRLTAPATQILLVGMNEDEKDFLQYVRSGSKVTCSETPPRKTLWERCGQCKRRGGVSGLPVRAVVPLPRARGRFPAVSDDAPADGTDPTRAADNTFDRARDDDKEIAKHFCLSSKP